MRKINARIKRARKNAKLKQKDMAEIFGLTIDAYSKKERAARFDAYELIKLSYIFNVDVREFFYDNPETEDMYIIPNGYFKLNDREADILTMYRYVKNEKKKAIFAYIFEMYKEN